MSLREIPGIVFWIAAGAALFIGLGLQEQLAPAPYTRFTDAIVGGFMGGFAYLGYAFIAGFIRGLRGK